MTVLFNVSQLAALYMPLMFFTFDFVANEFMNPADRLFTSAAPFRFGKLVLTRNSPLLCRARRRTNQLPS